MSNDRVKDWPHGHELSDLAPWPRAIIVAKIVHVRGSRVSWDDPSCPHPKILKPPDEHSSPSQHRIVNSSTPCPPRYHLATPSSQDTAQELSSAVSTLSAKNSTPISLHPPQRLSGQRFVCGGSLESPLRQEPWPH